MKAFIKFRNNEGTDLLIASSEIVAVYRVKNLVRINLRDDTFSTRTFADEAQAEICWARIEKELNG